MFRIEKAEFIFSKLRFDVVKIVLKVTNPGFDAIRIRCRSRDLSVF